MKLAFPHYEGDSILRPFIAPTIAAPAKLVKPAKVVRRNIETTAPEMIGLSSLELEMQVRAMRREYLREWIKGIFGRKDD
jgi:hypothetical protein